MSTPERRRVAILGGGAGAMTGAYYLSCTPERRARFDVTVYQMGWRLGGKGANGRRADAADRIEEHGLHVWGGFYYNAFRTMRACYQSLGRPAGAPLATVTDAFLPAPNVVWEEYVNGAWRNWPVAVPAIGGLPGEDGELPTPAAFFQMLIGFVRDVIVTFPHDAIRNRAAAPDESILSRVRHLFGGIELPAAQAVDGSARSLIHAAYALADAIRNGEAPEGHQTVLTLIEECWRWFASEVMSEIAANDEARRLYILADLAVAMATGMVRDHVLTRGFTSIDDQDFAEWLTAHGASTLAQRSAPLRGFYDYFFAYDQGDPAKPRMSAAMGLYHLLRLVFTYKQSLFFKMASGMGDTVFGPLFEVCRRNGVRFEFFHEVRELTPDASANRITAIHLIRQVETKADYMPLRDVAGLPSWPSEPLYDQIRDDQAARLRESGVDLEDPWSGWDGGVDVKLLEGRDFDLVVLGIPVGAHRMICRGLIDRLPEWRQMTEALQTIQTGTLQLWWTRPMSRLGDTGKMATGTAYGQPLESWSDMSHVLPLERWPGPERPETVVYFCGPMLTPAVTPSSPDPAFGAAQKAAARVTALRWCRQNLPHLYPGAMAGADLDWNALAVVNGSAGEARFDAQYIRANYTPSERYVLDLPGTSQYRLDADGSGFDNLLLAGDWVFTGLGGAVESAVIAGMQAAEALIGEPLGIVGALVNPWSRLPRFATHR